MSYSITSSWRGTVGVVKPTFRPGSLEEFIRLLPEGIGVIPLFLGVKKGTTKEFSEGMEAMKKKIAELAAMNVDLLHPEGAPLFMVRGYQGEQELVKELEEQHGIPIITPGMTQVEALKALNVKRMVGVTYFTGEINQMFARYFTEAGFEVLGMEGISVPFSEIGRLSSREVYAFARQQYIKYQNAQGLYMLGSGWHVLDVIGTLEQDLQIPVVHPVPARVWAVQKRLFVRQPVKGYGRLLEEMP